MVKQNRVPYRAEIDGLRCWAVIAVIGYHMNSIWLQGGYLGVDSFFVISGYLITSLLLIDLENGSFSLLGFWERRVRRIVPAASTTILLSSIISIWILYRPDLIGFTYQKIASLFSYANFYLLIEPGSYWDGHSDRYPFLHYWSLSVEEQFYMLYPIAIALVYKTFRKRLFQAVLVVSCLSYILYIIGIGINTSATFYLLPTRAWELGMGCLIAIGSRNGWIKKKSHIFSICGFFIVLISYVLGGNLDFNPLEVSLVVFGTALFIGTYPTGSRLFGLTDQLSVFIGRISYSLYLWHWPVLVYSRMYCDEQGVTIGKPYLFLITVTLGTASYFLVEQPFRKSKGTSPFILICMVLLGIFLILERGILLNTDYSSRLFRESNSHMSYFNLRESTNANKRQYRSVVAQDNNLPDESYKKGGIIKKFDHDFPKVVVLGNSHAVFWSWLIDQVITEHEIPTSFWSMIGVNPFFEIPITGENHGKHMSYLEMENYRKARYEHIIKWKPEIVILSVKWNSINLWETDHLFRLLEENAGSVLLIESPPELGKVGNRFFADYASYCRITADDNGNYYWPEYNVNSLGASRRILKSIIDKYERFYVLPTADLYLTNKGVLAAKNSIPLYLDDDHLTDEGTLLAKQRLEKAITSLINQKSPGEVCYSKGDEVPLFNNTGEAQ